MYPRKATKSVGWGAHSARAQQPHQQPSSQPACSSSELRANTPDASHPPRKHIAPLLPHPHYYCLTFHLLSLCSEISDTPFYQWKLPVYIFFYFFTLKLSHKCLLARWWHRGCNVKFSSWLTHHYSHNCHSPFNLPSLCLKLNIPLAILLGNT